MNFHSDEWIMERVREHYEEALQYFPEDRILGIFYQGSGNYGLDTEFSDVDTKLIVLPSFEELAMNEPAISTTHVRYNEEHIDYKDARLYFQTFRKQNINFLEILFTKYKIINPLYEAQWNRLVRCREDIAHYNVYRAMKAMYGMVQEKYHAMEHRYPAKEAIVDRWGFDGKQLSHLIRVYEFMSDYFNGESYQDCLTAHDAERLNAIKLQGYYTLSEARDVAKYYLDLTEELFKNNPDLCRNGMYDVCDVDVDILLNDVQRKVMEICIRKELLKNEM